MCDDVTVWHRKTFYNDRGFLKICVPGFQSVLSLYMGGVAMSVTIEILTYLAVVWDKRKIMQIYEFMSALTYSVGYNYHYNNAITNSFLKYSSIFTLLKSLILLQVTYKSWGVIILDGFGISKGLQNRISLQQLILQFSLLMINFFSW